MRGRRETKVAVSMGEAIKACLSLRVRRCAHVVFAWQAWHFVTFDSVSGGMCAHDRRETKVSVSMGEAIKACLSLRVRRCAHVVLRGRRGTL